MDEILSLSLSLSAYFPPPFGLNPFVDVSAQCVIYLMIGEERVMAAVVCVCVFSFNHTECTANAQRPGGRAHMI